MFRQTAAAPSQRVPHSVAIAVGDEFEDVAANQLIERIAEHLAHPAVGEIDAIVRVDRPDAFLSDLEDLLIRIRSARFAHVGFPKYRTGQLPAEDQP